MRKLKVVLVDDESIVISDLLTLIDWEKEGFIVEGWAYSPDSAIKLVKQSPRGRVCQDTFCGFSKLNDLSVKKSPKTSCLQMS